MVVGIREAKARFSHYLGVARDQGEVVITDRGRPVARLTAIDKAKHKSVGEVVAELEGAGLLEPARAGGRPRQAPVPVLGRASVSAAVRAARR